MINKWFLSFWLLIPLILCGQSENQIKKNSIQVSRWTFKNSLLNSRDGVTVAYERKLSPKISGRLSLSALPSLDGFEDDKNFERRMFFELALLKHFEMSNKVSVFCGAGFSAARVEKQNSGLILWDSFDGWGDGKMISKFRYKQMSVVAPIGISFFLSKSISIRTEMVLDVAFTSYSIRRNEISEGYENGEDFYDEWCHNSDLKNFGISVTTQKMGVRFHF